MLGIAPGGGAEEGLPRQVFWRNTAKTQLRDAFRRRPKASAKTAMWYSDAFVTATRPPGADRPPPPGGGAENAAQAPPPTPLSCAMLSAFLVNSQ